MNKSTPFLGTCAKEHSAIPALSGRFLGIWSQGRVFNSSVFEARVRRLDITTPAAPGRHEAVADWITAQGNQ
jgi:hypothetical protein